MTLGRPIGRAPLAVRVSLAIAKASKPFNHGRGAAEDAFELLLGVVSRRELEGFRHLAIELREVVA
jgi:hypothetical protein